MTQAIHLPTIISTTREYSGCDNISAGGTGDTGLQSLSRYDTPHTPFSYARWIIKESYSFWCKMFQLVAECVKIVNGPTRKRGSLWFAASSSLSSLNTQWRRQPGATLERSRYRRTLPLSRERGGEAPQ